VEALYGTLSPKKELWFRRHLESCPSCRKEFADMSETLEIMDRRKRFDPGREFWDSYWANLAKKLEAGESFSPSAAAAVFKPKKTRLFPFIPKYAFQAAIALAILATGIILGRLWFATRMPAGKSPGLAQESPSIFQSPVQAAAVQDYLDRSKIIILSLANFEPNKDDSYALNLDYQKKISGDLVILGYELKNQLASSRQKRLRELISDLEVILIQIANLDPENNIRAVEFVKDGIANSSILFKINVLEIGYAPGSPSKGKPADKT
jgi:hypothetical protein